MHGTKRKHVRSWVAGLGGAAILGAGCLTTPMDNGLGAGGGSGGTPATTEATTPAVSPPTAVTPPGDAGGLSSSDQAALLAAVNDVRTDGTSCDGQAMPAAPPLQLDARLEDAADVLADDMAANDFFSHTGSDGSTPFTRISAAGYDWDVAAENIAAGPTSVQSVVDGWYASPTHCTNFMNPNVTDVGFARADNPDTTFGTYWVADLADPA